ncbi:chromosome segregation protein SMC [Synoicihabitans lomoniglobus]|uniref:Chromosome partition protein Smc n=1 Tax=Synoicihabitans lomoniglobus TaxID=2909285 RepID=A0AAF0I2R8_9BACT|nr:chromosome segregation protein SMC [Opitutaceae bacterium LMO-M01]WED66687.1 chromosome segregation protein SMC [Opitutaceae bacterium LMO-M01]
MYLKALKLHGFKSFADPTTLRFEPGVTAIVGPNGCGKSNIADGIRWVLGEQSAKALRGGKMQDVIFEGTDSRRPSQLCEVSLLLTECEKQLGSEFHEIEIMRRVHRDGGSEYFFNGQSCRLKDIQKLFMDTGIGRTSYSIMAQGQIDQILSSKPEERRAVFEEAAGITKYKAQRREAMNKLSLTEQNLARVADVISEVGRQIGSLKRQASKALRYKRLSFRLRHLSLAHSAHQHGNLAATIAELETRLSGLRQAAEERRTKLETEQGELEEKKAERSRLNQRAQDAQQAVFDLKSQREQAENGGNLARIKRTGLEDRLASSKDNLGELNMQMRELSDQVDTGAQDKQEQLSLLGTSDSVFQNRNRELAVAESELTQLEEELKQTKFSLLQMESTIARLRTDTTGFEVDQRTSVQRHELLEQQMESARQEQAATTQRAAEIDLRLEEARAGKARLDQASAEAQQEIGNATREFREGQRVLQDIDRGLAQRSARLKLLQQLQEKWEGFGAGAKAVLQGRLDQALDGQTATPVTKNLQVDPAAGKAVEALLGAAVEAIHVVDLATARRVLTQLEQEQIGSAVLQVEGMGTTPDANGELPSFLQPATRALINLDAAHPATALLSACYLADDLDAFLDFWTTNPNFSFVAVATRKGELVDRRGLVFGGFNKKPENSIVQREIDLRETAKAIADEQQKHEAQKQVIELINQRIATAEQALEDKRREVLEATQLVAETQTEQRNVQRALEEGNQRIGRMERELAGLEAARNEAQERFDKAQAGLVQAEEQAKSARARIDEIEVRVVEVRTDRDVKRETLAQARLELAERRQKVEVLDRGIADMEKRRDQIAQILAQRQQEIEVWSEQIVALEHEAESSRARASQIGETLVVAQDQVAKIRTKLSEVEGEIEAVEAAQQGLRSASEQAQGDLGRSEVRLAEAKSRAQFIVEDVTREYDTAVDRLDWQLLLWRSDEEPPDMQTLDLEDDDDEGGETESGESTDATPKRRRKKKEPKGDPTQADLDAMLETDWPSIKTEVDALRQRLNSMGAVNLVAIEEYAELKQRFDFLKGQSGDLTDAKTELLSAIDEINRTSQEQFAITFEQIKKNFKYTFDTLFGGGRANLELIAAEDILESGIEITAQPPGTKLKSITLLSGGQKTLTAVALLFALYMVKPSPFCLLDELDAPLDESNIGRFTALLKKFVGESQFIIITHNKRTVSAAEAIYGVTMEERGVSKTVSMRFNHDHGEPESHPENIAEAVRGAQSVHQN